MMSYRLVGRQCFVYVQYNKIDFSQKQMRHFFNIFIQECRDPSIKNAVSPSKLAAAKNDARREWTHAEESRKRLQADVSRLHKSIEEAPVSKDQFLDR